MSSEELNEVTADDTKIKVESEAFDYKTVTSEEVEFSGDGEGEEEEESADVQQPPQSKKRHKRLMSTDEFESLPSQAEYEKELDELREHQIAGEAMRLHQSDTNIKLVEAEAEDSPITVIPHDDREFVGLVEEVPLDQRKKRKSTGKVRKRPPAVNFDTAVDIIRIPRINNHFLGEGEFSEELPPELEDILSEEDYVSSIQNINEVLHRIPTMRTGAVFVPPTVLVSLVMLYMILFFKSPPFVPLMVIFGFWCTCALGVLFGAGIYYLFQREYHMAVSKEDVRQFHKGIRFAIQLKDRTALYIVIEPGEDRND